MTDCSHYQSEVHLKHYQIRKDVCGAGECVAHSKITLMVRSHCR